MDKQTFLGILRDEQRHWEAFLAAIPEHERDQPGACGIWSVQDVVGHVAMWERYVTALVRAHQRGGVAAPHELWGEFVPPPELADDPLNQWYVEQLKQRSYGELLGEQREVRNQLVGTVEALSEHTFGAPEIVVEGLVWNHGHPLWRAIREMSYEHVHTHTMGMRSALDVR
jgi:hypothetical protein